MATVFENLNPNDPRTNGETMLLNLFKHHSLFNNWFVYEQPHINGAKPDFILTHPQKGIIIIEVKDWNLDLPIYNKPEHVLGSNGQYIPSNPIHQVDSYKEDILKYELKTSVDIKEQFPNDYYGFIETVVFFSNVDSPNMAKSFCNSAKYPHTKIWTRFEINTLMNSSTTLESSTYTYGLTRKTSKYSTNELLQQATEELNHKFRASDYIQARKKPYILTGQQAELAKLSPNSIRRWSGVAGSGKTLVLAEKAAQAIKERKRVLILTYNITLRHYIKDLCSQQYGSNNRKDFNRYLTVRHYHGFLNSFFSANNMKISLFQEEEVTNQILKILTTHSQPELSEFDYILIDEGQDFKNNWVLNMKYFFTGKGEFVVFYDKAQDLYERFTEKVWIEDPEQIKQIGFKGRPGYLKESLRIPPKVIDKINQLNNHFQANNDNILYPSISLNNQQLSVLNEHTLWYNVNSSTIKKQIQQVLVAYENLEQLYSQDDITILTTNENTGVEIVKALEAKGKKVTHVYDLNKSKDLETRRNEKWKFYGGTGRLKVSSIHSFKGWESPSIIFVFDSLSTIHDDKNIIVNKKDISHRITNMYLFLALSRMKAKIDTGEYTFICLNYMPEYNNLVHFFDNH